MTTTNRFRLAYVGMFALAALFVGSFALSSSLFPKPKPKHWLIDPSAWGQYSDGQASDGVGAARFVVLGPKGDKSAVYELDMRQPQGIRLVDHPANGSPDTLAAAPQPDPCATLFEGNQLAAAALERGCQPPSADPRSQFTILVVNKADQPRVVEIDVR